ncbi:efflux RND transporter periplasmic adaptor subunit [Catenovulum sediminis]|uniref:Efflux RND transporter periplasmic adaptor subunit n=1 Tax=Catenovulum sediminis TaxID=1740262 RepID=A0ABV1RL36_9ALTE|nr:efflux RND transporter periplasmic adaptor subunit [Catenovulum sediminis]
MARFGLSAMTLISSLLLLSCDKQTEPPKQPIRSIAWQTVNSQPLTQMRRLPGILNPVESAPLSFQVSGKIEAIYVHLGDSVSSGQKLAQLQLSNYKLALQAAQGELEKAKAFQREREAEFARYEQLLEQQLVSRSVYDNAKSQAQSAASSVDVAHTQLEIAQKNLNDATLYAPYDGRITNQLAEPSQQVASGQTVFEIEGQHGLEIAVLVPETLIKEVKNGQTYKVRAPVVKDKELSAYVSEISSRAENANAFRVVLNFSEEHPDLRAGMSVEVDFVYRGSERNNYQGSAFNIPVSALLAGKDKQTFVFVYNPQTSLLEKRQVVAENILGNQVLITQGLTSGEIIATAGVSFLQDGQQVNLFKNDVKIFN